MALSSNSIIHFTKTKSSLMGILENSFQPYYCKEKIHFLSVFRELLVPMVSFCDIPLSGVKDHINKYGAYGIGLTKEWAQRQGLNPVLYIERNSALAKSMDYAIDKFIDEKEGDLEDLNDAEKSIFDVLRYTKNYQADLNRGGKTIKDYRFSDEREWRYVPSFSEKIPMIIGGSILDDTDFTDFIERAKLDLSNFSLNFEPNDIKYIIIENDEEISEFLDFLKKARGRTYSYHDIERLMTRILTTEQIVSDI